MVEANGGISAFPRSDLRPVQTGEMGVDPGYEGMPMILIMDGRIQPDNLKQSGHDEKWLAAQLSRHGLSAGGVYLASLSTKGEMLLQLRGGGVQTFAAQDPAKVGW